MVVSHHWRTEHYYEVRKTFGNTIVLDKGLELDTHHLLMTLFQYRSDYYTLSLSHTPTHHSGNQGSTIQ